MIDGGVGITAVVGVASKFVERSKFTARHDASCDKEAGKTVMMAERFDRIPQEDVDYFELQEFNRLHSRSMENLRIYREVQEEYKQKDWFKEPWEKLRTRGRVRQAKRSLQSSSAQEERHLHDLETYSRANSSCGSSIHSRANSLDSGLNLEWHTRPYRTDLCSIRAVGSSPPNASLDDIRNDEEKDEIANKVSAWRSLSLLSSLAADKMDVDESTRTEGTSLGLRVPELPTPLSKTSSRDSSNGTGLVVPQRLRAVSPDLSYRMLGQEYAHSVPVPLAPFSAPLALGVSKCASCKTTWSPEWRKGPSGKRDLCNACGLRYARSRAKRSQEVRKNRYAAKPW